MAIKIPARGLTGLPARIMIVAISEGPAMSGVASGTMNEEHGVFFTLRPSALSSLEGVHELTVQFIVPLAWRGDAVRIACQATGEQKVLWMKQQKVFGEKSIPVALYLSGDSGARRAADRFARQ